ncbi:response regulator transcription factor [Bacillus sp. NP157]|nr:response regulator transcription factor [Bacillus sp. NP157]
MPPIRVLIVDDHDLLRDGLRATIARSDGMEVVGEASDGAGALDAYGLLRPDVVLLDIEMPGMDGLDALQALRRIDPACRIVMLTSYLGDARVSRAVSLGAIGYVHKTAQKEFIVNAVRKGAHGSPVFSPDVWERMADAAPSTALHAREVACLALASEGLGNREIAERLGVPTDTVKTRLKSAFGKLGTHDRIQAIAAAIERGYL